LAGAWGLTRVRPEPRLRLTAWLALFAAAADRLRPAAEAGAARILWTPFGGQMAGLHGLTDTLAAVWPYLAVAYAGVRLRLAPPWVVALGGALAVAAFAFGLEALQAHVPGRYPDATDPLLALIGWLLPWCHPAVRRAAAPTVQ
jgi:VanZ family protein